MIILYENYMAPVLCFVGDIAKIVPKIKAVLLHDNVVIAFWTPAGQPIPFQLYPIRVVSFHWADPFTPDVNGTEGFS